jgi:hypothetical protein
LVDSAVGNRRSFGRSVARGILSVLNAGACSLLLLSAAAIAAEPIAQMDVFISTGDNHFLGSSLPIDSPGSISATFDFLREVNHARRIYWRGLEEATWIETMHARSENPRYYSLWQWLEWLYANVHPDQTAVTAAHERGQEIWGVGTMFDWGGPADTPTFGDYPFPFESKLKQEHPEWAPVDRHGGRKQGGPIELAYPEARHALVDLHVRETLKAGYDGITFLTYSENYALRFQDEFGFSDPIVDAFKKQHRVDLRTEPFKRFGSREDWLRLRGSYITEYLRELRAALKPHGKKLGVILNGNDIHQAQMWNVPETLQSAGAFYMDVETWVREGLVDNLAVYGNCSPQAQSKSVEDLLFLCRGTPVEITLLTSSPLDPGKAHFYARGVKPMLAVSDEMQHLARGFIPVPAADAWNKAELPVRMRGLEQIIAGKLTAGVEECVPSLKSANLIERRLALFAIAKLSEKEPARAAALIEPLLDDPENGVRCVAALAIGELHHAPSQKPLLAALEKNGNHMLLECVIIALRKMRPFPGDELMAVVKTSKNPVLRTAAMRAVLPQPTFAQMADIRAAMLDPDRFTAFAAAETIANIRKTNAAILPLIRTMGEPDAAVANRAAVSLGVIGARHEKETESLRPTILSSLRLAFEGFGAGSSRPDADWGYRPIGNALRAMGPEGEEILRQLRDQRSDLQLAERAWRVLDLHQQPNTYSEVTEKENEEAYSRRPQKDDPLSKTAATPQPPGRELKVDPATGDDKSDGLAKPSKTIARAIRLAQPGDTIHLAPAVYYETADFSTKHGELGRRITLDGHGALLEGSDAIRAEEWEQVAPGLFKNVKLIRMDDAILGRWFFLWNGEMNHMGRTSKGKSAPLKKPADLQPNEWTYVAAEDAFYLRLPPGQDLAKANIRYPARGNGIVMSLMTSHICVRNVTFAHVYNDGCNIHGVARDTRFENITSLECGDDGFSAHDDCQCEIDGFISIGNSTGFADVGTSETHYRRVVIADCLGTDVLVYGDGLHSMEKAVIFSAGSRPFGLDPSSGRSPRPVTFEMKDVIFQRTGPRADLLVSKNAELTAARCAFLDAPMRANGPFTFANTLWAGGTPSSASVPTLWAGEGNRYRPTASAELQTKLGEILEKSRALLKSAKTARTPTLHTVEELGLQGVLQVTR